MNQVVNELNLYQGDQLIGQADITTNTGSWQTWADVTTYVNLNAGKQEITFKSASANYNLNYIKFEK